MNSLEQLTDLAAREKLWKTNPQSSLYAESMNLKFAHEQEGTLRYMVSSACSRRRNKSPLLKHVIHTHVCLMQRARAAMLTMSANWSIGELKRRTRHAALRCLCGLERDRRVPPGRRIFLPQPARRTCGELPGKIGRLGRIFLYVCIYAQTSDDG